MNLNVNFLDLDFKNPLIVASGPWSRDAESIQKSIDSGAGGVVTETITLEATGIKSPYIYSNNRQIFNTKLYSDIDLEQWEIEFEKIDKKDCKLIASIWASSPSELAYLAKRVERMGADAVELSLSAPIGTKSQALNIHEMTIAEYVSSAVNSVDIPVMVKLSYDTCSSIDFIRRIEKCGAKAISAIDSLRGIQGVDINNRQVKMPTFGGYTGENIRPISLAITASLQQSTKCQICSTGGIVDYINVLEFIMLGARTVQIASTLLLNGYNTISDILSKLDSWMTDNNTLHLNSIRGSALNSLHAFEDIENKPQVCQVLYKCKDSNCRKCINFCIYNAISYNENAVLIDKTKCRGCGSCVEFCPEKSLNLKYIIEL